MAADRCRRELNFFDVILFALYYYNIIGIQFVAFIFKIVYFKTVIYIIILIVIYCVNMLAFVKDGSAVFCIKGGPNC